MINIKNSNKADTRTCNVSMVTIDEFMKDIKSHIKDVEAGMNFFAEMISTTGEIHDQTKILHSKWFYDDFKTEFKEHSWYKMHQETERHHLSNPEYVQDDVNLIDVLEMITDGVMAGMARSGEYRKEDISDELLRKAFDNTVDLLLKQVKVID